MAGGQQATAPAMVMIASHSAASCRLDPVILPRISWHA